MNYRDLLVDAMTELDEDLVMEYVQKMIQQGVSISAIQMCMNIGVRFHFCRINKCLFNSVSHPLKMLFGGR